MRGAPEDWQSATRESYDRVASAYAEQTREAPRTNEELRAVYAQLLDLCPPRPPGARPIVVDAGCGPGWWAGHLAGLGAAVVGLDLSRAMVAVGRQEAPAARFGVGSLLALPIADGCADAVACMYVLHHLPDDAVAPALDELVRVLRPGGVVLVGGHVGDDRRLKTEGYGGLPMHVQLNRRPAPFWEKEIRARGLLVEAHAVDGPAAGPTHALFARVPRTGARA